MNAMGQNDTLVVYRNPSSCPLFPKSDYGTALELELKHRRLMQQATFWTPPAQERQATSEWRRSVCQKLHPSNN
jgi:hypothetical protein